MALLRGGTDTSVIALWMGHESPETTQVYLHADMSIKEQALGRVHQPGTSPGRYQPPDTLLAFLENPLAPNPPGYADPAPASSPLATASAITVGIIQASA